MAKVPDSVPEDERIWFSLAAYNMGWGHMLDARKLTKTQKATRTAGSTSNSACRCSAKSATTRS